MTTTLGEVDEWMLLRIEGKTLAEIAKSVGRSKRTISRHTSRDLEYYRNKESWKTMGHEINDIGYDGDFFTHTAAAEKPIADFVANGGPEGVNLWGSDFRRQIATGFTQDIFDSFYQYYHNSLWWVQWIGPIANDWALSEEGEDIGTSEIYGLSASYFISQLVDQSDGADIFKPLVEEYITKTLVTQIEDVDDETVIRITLELYRDMAVRIAKYLKTYLNIAQPVTNMSEYESQAYRLAYLNTIWHSNEQEFNQSKHLNTTLFILETSFQNRNHTPPPKEAHPYIRQGRDAALRDISAKKIQCPTLDEIFHEIY